MTDEKPFTTVIVGHGRLLTQLTRLTFQAQRQKGDFYLHVGTEMRLFLDRVTGGKGSFNRIPYVEDPKAESNHVELRKKGVKTNGNT